MTAPLPPVPPPGPGSVQVAATIAEGGVGELVVAETDLRTAWVLVAPPGISEGTPGRARTTPDRLVDDVLDRLSGLAPGHAEPEQLAVPAELAIGFVGALRAGDVARVDAVCADQGWAGPPTLLAEAATSLQGTAQLIVRSDSTAPLHYASLLHLPRGWVHVERTADVILHRRVAREDLAALLVSALAAHADALAASREEAGDE